MKLWNLPGTPDVARRAAAMNSPPNTTASSTEKNTLSMLSAEKSRMPRGALFVRKVM
jgi:hypothetical protein